MAEQGEKIGVAAAEGYRLVVLDQDPDQNVEIAEIVAAQKPAQTQAEARAVGRRFRVL
jgi:hypothetical protein